MVRKHKVNRSWRKSPIPDWAPKCTLKKHTAWCRNHEACTAWLKVAAITAEYMQHWLRAPSYMPTILPLPLDQVLNMPSVQGAEAIKKLYVSLEAASHRIPPAVGNFEKDFESAFREKAKGNIEFGKELWSALANVEWTHPDVKEPYITSFRSAGGWVADLVGLDTDYLDFYCASPYAQVSPEIEEVMKNLGWTYDADYTC